MNKSGSMRAMFSRSLLLLTLACLFAGIAGGIGCTAGSTKSFDVSVHNKSGMPVMLWLSKDGPPPEKGWFTTEQFLEAPPGEPSPGVDLPPDKTANTGKISGKFPEGTHAILEIFANEHNDRQRSKAAGVLTLRLQPGKNDLTVKLDPQGRLVATDTGTGAAIEPSTRP
jgi:hypothetical protein